MRDIVDGGYRIADRKRTIIRVARETVVVLAERRTLILDKICASDCLIQKKGRIL